MLLEEEAQLRSLTEFMIACLGGDESGHDHTHIDRVVALSKHILTTEPAADEFTVLAAATLHDTYDDKLFEDVVGAKMRVASKLASIGVPADVQTEIFQIIDNMSWSKQRFGDAEPLTLNGQIVQDADRLEAIGAMGVARTIQYGVSKHHALYNPAIKPKVATTKAEYRREDDETVINHFYEKLFLIKDYLNTAEGKRIGAKRDAVMHDFVAAFEAEWDGTDFLN